MAKQTKKLRKNIKARAKAAAPPSSETKPQGKVVGKDYFLIGILFFTAVVLIIGWEQFSVVNRAMYILLGTSLGITYIRRHKEFTEQQGRIMDRIGYVAIGIAAGLFLLSIFQQYFAQEGGE